MWWIDLKKRNKNSIANKLNNKPTLEVSTETTVKYKYIQKYI